MGVAAYNRTSKVISEVISKEVHDAIDLERLGMAHAIAEECNAFVTAAMTYMAEPRGLRERTILAARNRRGWQKRNEAVGKAHCAWVDESHVSTTDFHRTSVARAQAVHALFVFALGTWRIPDHIAVPRAAIA